MQTNSSETVKEVTSQAFKCLPDVKSAINELTKLKAVGPATASGKYRMETGKGRGDKGKDKCDTTTVKYSNNNNRMGTGRGREGWQGERQV